MSKPRRWSIASAHCRLPFESGVLHWRPSRIEGGLLLLLGGMGGCAALASALPRPAAWLLALWALAHALRCRCRGLRRSPRALRLTGTLPRCDGRPMPDLRAHWRGPLVVLCWGRGARAQRLAFWPDTLPGPARRELRLALLRLQAAPDAASMAP